jgi:hypothetical protein
MLCDNSHNVKKKPMGSDRKVVKRTHTIYLVIIIHVRCDTALLQNSGCVIKHYSTTTIWSRGPHFPLHLQEFFFFSVGFKPKTVCLYNSHVLTFCHFAIMLTLFLGESEDIWLRLAVADTNSTKVIGFCAVACHYIALYRPAEAPITTYAIENMGCCDPELPHIIVMLKYCRNL